MDGWLKAALAYIPRWIDFQLWHADQPGAAIALAHRGELVLEEAFGVASQATGEPLDPSHRFRAASHSKTFTAAGIMRLKERGLLRLDDVAGSFVSGLDPQVAEATLGQLLSHTAGLTRDGADAGQFRDERPYLSAEEVKAELALPQPIPAGVRFKYSNHGYGLLGLVIESVAGEPYGDWIAREVIAAAGLTETVPDIAHLTEGRLVSGHGTRLPLGRRPVVPADNPTNGLASAAGFVSTAGDLARFFAQLSPEAETSFLTPASRREMTRRHWKDVEAGLERYYGLGTISGDLKGWDWFGHSGSFQGMLTRTAVFPKHEIAVSVLTNAVDGPSQGWVDGIGLILKAFAEGGAPAPETADWGGRWWGLWGAVDLVPIGSKVVAASPALPQPFAETVEIAVTGPDAGRVTRASGFSSPGETVRRLRGADGEPAEIWVGGGRLLPEGRFAEEIQRRYGA